MHCISGSPKPENFKADVIFLVDSSNSISSRDFANQKQFIRNLAESLNIFGGQSRAALLNYGSSPKQEIAFGSYKTESEFRSLLNSIKTQGGARRFDFALQEAVPMLQKVRSDVPKIAVLVTGGRNAYPYSDILSSTVKLIHGLGARIFVVSVGKNLLGSEIQSLVHSRSDLVEVKDFDSLKLRGREIGRKIISSLGKQLL